MGDDRGDSELRRLIAESLARFGVAGDVWVGDGRVTLQGSGSTVHIELGTVLSEWPTLNDDARRRRANDLARSLANARRTRTTASPPPSSARLSDVLVRAAIGIGALIVVGGAWTAYRRWDIEREILARSPRDVHQDYDAYEAERNARAARVCDATRSRVMRGAAVGPADVEGWVVDLDVLTSKDGPSPAASPRIAEFVGPGPGKRRVVFAEAPSLASADGPDTEARVVEANLPDSGPLLFRGVRLELAGRYVIPYFHETERAEVLRLARAFSDAIGAEYTALYARCAGGSSHHLGSFFRGPTPGGAVAALLYAMGVPGDHPDVRMSLLAPEGASAVDPAFAFRNVENATSALKKVRIMTMLGAEGGMIAGLDGQSSTITFPFRDSNRASRASREIARDLGIGENR